MSPTDLLEVTDLSVVHPGPVRAVDGVSLALAPGAALVLLGESGSGKTTLARTLIGLPGRSARVTGRISLAGTELSALDERALSRVRGRRIGYVPQDPGGSLDPLRRIGPQLAEVLRRHRITRDRRATGDAVVRLLATAGIPDPERVARAYPHELSGGLRQRAAIAVAIACGPDLVIADEPTTALDALVRGRILDLFATLRADCGIALLLVTHDLAVARRVGGDVAVMREGRVVEAGPAARVLSAPGHPFTAALLAADPGARR
ncbi:ABC transporter ATP-binding protein [Streptomyces sp. BE303]|uniref:ABC transporter ATP-binding protein n=1 Tax=Streptomyces sp. BE303 TaxID=3002528 RepID=UPI002E7872E6|nr:ABC transporter ATP-binding protein [Streptomyces sp. BE303]MED7955253.1 ABC transporter ATP-binding protein [Streptomyces sp. BE303]